MPNRKSNRKPSAMQAVRRLEHKIQGVSIKPRADPPAITLTPWFNLTVQFVLATTTTAVTHTVSNLRTQLLAQLDLPTDQKFGIRIREVRAWGPLAGDLTATFYDFTNAASPLSNQRDVGNATSRPHCGYVYPSAISTKLFGASSNEVASFSAPVATGFANTGALTVHYLTQFHFEPA